LGQVYFCVGKKESALKQQITTRELE